MKVTRKIFSGTLGAIAIVSVAPAATVTVSATAPTPDGDDISMLASAGQYDIGGDPGHIWSNRQAQGQTFTTGSNAGGYQLNAVTLQNLNNTEGDDARVFTLRVGTISGTSFTQIGTDSGSPPAYAPLDFITVTLDTPITLAANTLYGFDFGTNGRGFVTVNNADSNYAGGSAYSSGAAGVGDGTVTLHDGPNTGGNSGDGDRIFHLDITTIPEPSSVLLSFAGVALLLRRRR